MEAEVKHTTSNSTRLYLSGDGRIIGKSLEEFMISRPKDFTNTGVMLSNFYINYRIGHKHILEQLIRWKLK